jgi:fluoroquinolone transport system permease protein
LGWGFNVLQFSIGVFFITLLFSLAGVILISYAEEFLNYVLASVPVLIVLSVPLLPYFELSQASWLLWSPTQGATDLMVSTYDSSVHFNSWWAYGSTLVWVLVFYGLGYWRFYGKMGRA